MSSGVQAAWHAALDTQRPDVTCTLMSHY